MKFSVISCGKANRRLYLLYLCALLFVIFAALTGLCFGSTPMTISDILHALANRASHDAETRIFWYVRFPRTCACLLTGSALATAGALIQGVLANPLASPGIIGVNAGAGLAVTLCTALGLYGGWALSFSAFLGAFAAVILITLCAGKWMASRSTVILTGVALNSFLNAISDTIITFDPNVGMMSNDFKIGDFSAVTYGKLIPSVIIILLTLAVVFSLSNELDVLSLGEETALGLGMNTRRTRVLFLLFSALLAGCAVSLAGLLSFVGLLVPHAVRRAVRGHSTHLLPLCALYGAGFVTCCDTAARTLFAPYEIPVGIIMAFLGAPFFVWILIRKKGGTGHDHA